MSDKELIELGRKYLGYQILNGTIVHELRHNVTGLSGTLQDILDRSTSREQEIKDYLEDAHYYMDRISTLIQFLGERGQEKIKNLSLRGMILDILKLLEKPRGKGVVDLHIEEDIQFRGKRGDLILIFYNLLMNSYEALQRVHDPKIHLSCYEEFDLIICRIQDNGKGIKKELLEKVAEPGFTDKLRGTGMGLSIVKSLVEDSYNGKVEIESTINVGTTVTLTLSNKI